MRIMFVKHEQRFRRRYYGEKVAVYSSLNNDYPLLTVPLHIFYLELFFHK